MLKEKKYLELKDLVHDKKKFDKLPELLKKKIFKFLRDSHNKERKRQKIDNLKKKIKSEFPLIKKLSKEITTNYNYIKNELSIGKQDIYIRIEPNGKSFRVDIDWKGSKKKFTIGHSLSDLKKISKKYNPKLTDRITIENYREIVKKSIYYNLVEKLEKIGRPKFESLHKIKIDEKTFDFIFVNKKDLIEKGTGKPTKPEPTLEQKSSTSQFDNYSGKKNESKTSTNPLTPKSSIIQENHYKVNDKFLGINIGKTKKSRS
jgi:hypothetical protein